jgi:hypothetical protein
MLLSHHQNTGQNHDIKTGNRCFENVKQFIILPQRVDRPSKFSFPYLHIDRLCGLVVRVPGYRSSGPGFDFRRYHIF